MKKFIMIPAILMAMMSCEKTLNVDSYDTANDGTVTVSFSVGIESGNINTRSFADELLNDLEYNYPSKLTISNGFKSYEVDLTSSNTISIQKGVYNVSASGGQFAQCAFIAQDKVPLIAGNNEQMSQQIEITESKNYEINLIIGGFIIACPKNQVSEFKWEEYDYEYGPGRSMSNKNLQETENYYYYILSMAKALLGKGDRQYKTICVGMYENDGYETTYKTMNIFTGGEGRAIGKYFLFTSNENSYKAFSLNRDSFEDGGVR